MLRYSVWACWTETFRLGLPPRLKERSSSLLSPADSTATPLSLWATAVHASHNIILHETQEMSLSTPAMSRVNVRLPLADLQHWDFNGIYVVAVQNSPVSFWLTSTCQWSWWGFTCLSSSVAEFPTIWSQVNSLFPLKSLPKTHLYPPLFDAVLSKPLEPFDLLYVLSYTFIVYVIPKHFVLEASL